MRFKTCSKCNEPVGVPHVDLEGCFWCDGRWQEKTARLD